jgi:putative membrane protein
MPRNTSHYLVLVLKGIAMGAADAVPGVSGGTIAFISGIYEELISSINNVNFSLIKTWRTKGFKAAWNQLNGSFLLALVSGILISILSLMKVAKYLLEYYPVLIWSFFFGLVLASIFFIGKQISKWNARIVITLILGALTAYYITTLPQMSDNTNLFFLFIAGAIAICAMILPGISGAFILILLGAYSTMSETISNLIDSIVETNFDKFSASILIFMVFALGALTGLISFSKLLKWLFSNYKDLTLAVLSGFILGSLNKIWPWKQTLTTRINSKGVEVPLLQESISPLAFNGENYLTYAVLLMVVGFMTILILERLGGKKNVQQATNK